MRIDSHQHFWRYEPAQYPWIGDRMQVLRRDYLPSELQPLLRASGFEGTIAVQAQQATPETDWLLELADQQAFIRGVVGWVDLRAPDLDKALGRYSARPKLVGVRHIVHDEPDDDFLLREDFRRGIGRLRAHALVYDLLLFPKHLPRAVKLVEEFPDQPFVLDHIAKPFIRDGLVSPWREDLRRLASFPNVSCKLSGMVTEARWSEWQPKDLRPYLDVVLEAFGAGRLMIGSDWPVCTLAADYARTMDAVVDWAGRLPAAERDGILGGNTARVYGLDAGRISPMSGSMTAAVLHGARDVRVEKYPRPELGPGQALLRVRRVGMCGSDLHYFQHGYCAGFVPTRPFVLGHELSAEVAAVADDVSGLAVGSRVAVNPARACGACDACRGGRRNLCPRTVMLGSASTKPPTDGAFAELVAVRADQCHALPDALDDAAGAMIEPLAVALHAVRRAGTLQAKRVLVSGAGTIGLLAAMTSRALGAASVASIDVAPGRRAAALKLGADHALDPADPALEARVRELGDDGFDVVIEAAGAPESLRRAFALVRAGGTIVQVGTLGAADVPLPANQLMNREVQLVGSFRYADVFADAIALVAKGALRVDELVSEAFPLADAAAALTRAADTGSVIKVQIQVAPGLA